MLIGTLRKAFGQKFAAGFAAEARLEDVLPEMDELSLTRLIEYQQDGTLEVRIKSVPR